MPRATAPGHGIPARRRSQGCRRYHFPRQESRAGWGGTNPGKRLPADLPSGSLADGGARIVFPLTGASQGLGRPSRQERFYCKGHRFPHTQHDVEREEQGMHRSRVNQGGRDFHFAGTVIRQRRRQLINQVISRVTTLANIITARNRGLTQQTIS